MARLLATQQYVKVIRKVDSITQKDTEQERTIYLYEDKIVTKHREFRIEIVDDMSYRFIGKQGGMLYLHTNKGVFSYIVKVSPVSFVRAFDDLKGKI